jgi:hypothetical protein
MRSLALIAAVALTSACSFSTSTSGEDNHASFSYDACLFGCATTQAMMVGTEESIGVSGSIPPVAVLSSDPSVVAIGQESRTCCRANDSSSCQTLAPTDACAPDMTARLSISVSALAAGTAKLRLVQSDGTTFDDVTLTVAEPVGLAVTCSSDGNNAPMPSTVTQSCFLGWTATDKGGNPLIATTGVTFTTSNANVVAFSGPSSLLGQPQIVDTITPTQALFQSSSLMPTGPGDAIITVAASQAKVLFAVHSTP